MPEISFDTLAYAKIIMHAKKNMYSAVNGVLLASKPKDNSKACDLNIVDAMPLFHHSHYLSPMAEIALTQIDAIAQAKNLIIAGYYVGCENYYDNTIDKCPGLKIAEKIAEHFPSAVLVIIDNATSFKPFEHKLIIHKNIDGKWKLCEDSISDLEDADSLTKVELKQFNTYEMDLVDFDDYLDDLTLDWTNKYLERVIEQIRKEN